MQQIDLEEAIAMAKRVGRPPIPEDERVDPVVVRLSRALVQEIDAEREGRLDSPGRSTMIRELLVEALEARAKKRGRK